MSRTVARLKMTFLPIVERELRVAARKGGTYWCHRCCPRHYTPGELPAGLVGYNAVFRRRQRANPLRNLEVALFWLRLLRGAVSHGRLPQRWA